MTKELVPTTGHYDDLMQQILVLIHLHQMLFNVLIICMSCNTLCSYMLALVCLCIHKLIPPFLE